MTTFSFGSYIVTVISPCLWPTVQVGSSSHSAYYNKFPTVLLIYIYSTIYAVFLRSYYLNRVENGNDDSCRLILKVKKPEVFYICTDLDYPFLLKSLISISWINSIIIASSESNEKLWVFQSMKCYFSGGSCVCVCSSARSTGLGWLKPFGRFLNSTVFAVVS